MVETIQGTPYAISSVKGNAEENQIYGTVCFYPWANGTIVKLEIMGLPQNEKNNFWGFHIHENGDCSDFESPNSFANAGEHWNAEQDLHSNHIGDLPLIYSNDGYSYMIYYTSRFTPEEVIGKSVIIHKNVDDLNTQPSGNSGERIACGVITGVKK